MSTAAITIQPDSNVQIGGGKFQDVIDRLIASYNSNVAVLQGRSEPRRRLPSGSILCRDFWHCWHGSADRDGGQTVREDDMLQRHSNLSLLTEWQEAPVEALPDLPTVSPP